MRGLTLAIAALSALAPAGALANRVDGYDPGSHPGSWRTEIQDVIGAGEMWNDGWTGRGVDVAVIDTGVASVDGLRGAKVVHGPDLSFESQAENLRHLDSAGHGTHMAGLIAGRDDDVTTPQKGEDRFLGVAPDARIVSLKVGDALGTVDVSQVIAAIHWVTQHRRDNGLNIRVLNLSFGTDGTQPYLTDPLVHAVETAWRHGIVVVVSAGNGGAGTGKLNDPAYAPRVIAVGAVDGRGTKAASDDVIPDWSSRDATRPPDLVAPGRSVVSLRVPGSVIDVENPGARVGSRFFRGSGTSQAAAFVSGAAALVLQRRPWLTPDQVKALLRKTARPLPGVETAAQGAGMLNLKRVVDASTPRSVQTTAPATGTGTLEGSRGSGHIAADGVDLSGERDDGQARRRHPDGDERPEMFELTGERDIFGAAFDAPAMAAKAELARVWSRGNWNANLWTGSGFAADGWATVAWSGVDWTGGLWTRSSWSRSSWSRSSWSDEGWTRSSWSRSSWSRSSWSSAGWGTEANAGP